MANKRLVSEHCNNEVFAIGQEGSIKDLSTKLNVCFECIHFVSCKGYIHNAKRLVASLENLEYMAKQIKEEQKLY